MTDTALDPAWAGHALLTVEQMGRADSLTIKGGTPGLTLMEAAGAAVEEEIVKRFSERPVAILCGPGNNGGDGFVIARLLQERGWPVRLALLGAKGKLKGDAAANAERWTGKIETLGPAMLDGADLVVDALFGAGLDRPLDGVPKDVVEAVVARGLDCVAVDAPSGVHGDSGEILGAAPEAALTVTFFRKKPGHLLLPGRLCCGETVVRQIGIGAGVLEEIKPAAFENHPDLWRGALPEPTLLDHKYSRGHLLIAGGAEMTGAARLAARAGLRGGAGMVTIAAPPAAAPVYAGDTAAFLVRPAADAKDFAGLAGKPNVSALVVGPGLGQGDRTRAIVRAALATGRPAVIDADGLTAFAGDPAGLAGRGPHVLTPHEGEFARLFDTAGDKLARARRAAAETGAVVLLKGGDTVIAEPGGRAAITANAPAWLATAGAGDVLAGLIGAFLAQGMNAFPAALAASWIHAEAANLYGRGLIADDLPELIPAVIGAVA